MIRLSSRGGVGLRSFALSLVMLAPLAASAADANFTNRIIVKYKTAPAAATNMAGTTKMGAAGTLSAQRFGVGLNPLRTTALGSQVLKVDRQMSLAEATRLAADIAASDPNVEYAEP